MRILLLVSALALLATAQWALDPSTGYRGWTLTTDATLPVSLSATVQLLPTPYWQEWVVGNWTAGFAIGRGCTIQAGSLRYGIYVSRNAYVETPPVLLGQNFTVVAAFKPRYSVSSWGWVILWRAVDLGYRMLGTYDTSSATIFRLYDAHGNQINLFPTVGAGFLTLVYVGEYLVSTNTYYMRVYSGGRLVAERAFHGQRSPVAPSVFRLGGEGDGTDQQLWNVVFAVYNRALSASEIAAWRPEAPVGGGLEMYYYAHPQFVRDVDGDGVLEWLDLSGNNRHAKLRGAVPQWFIEPVAVSVQQCGGVSLSAQWDGFTAMYTVNGTSRSVFEPGRVHFDGRTSYAVASINFYGWEGVTVEMYIHMPTAQRRSDWLYFLDDSALIYGYTWYPSSYVGAGFALGFGTRVGSPFGSRNNYECWWPYRTGRWIHATLTYDSSTRSLKFYVNGTLGCQYLIPSGEYTILDINPSTDHSVQYLFFGANSARNLQTQVAFSYVRIYSRALSQQEIQHNYRNPNSPAINGLEVWLSWDSFRGNVWLDKSGKGRHATVHGPVFSYPHWQWTAGVYLQHGYPTASPLIVTDFRLNNASWTSGVH
ncbi:MAG: LamG-like jellyroll fold domain-containing protein, partial [Pyrobaculum sp.]